MYIVFYANNQYQIGRIVETYKNHLQVDLGNSAKKIKVTDKIYDLAIEDLTQFHNNLAKIKAEIDLELLELLLEENTNRQTINHLAQLYFGDTVTLESTTALLLLLHDSCLTFISFGGGEFALRSKDDKALQQQLLAEKVKFATNLEELIAELKSLCHEAELIRDKGDKQEFKFYDEQFLSPNAANLDDYPKIIENLPSDLVKAINRPERNGLWFKALSSVCHELKINQLEFIVATGIVTDVAKFMLEVFLQNNFPQGVNYEVGSDAIAVSEEDPWQNLPHNQEVEVFSIDSVTTTEIDDAFSVRVAGDGYTIGIHIAAPALDKSLSLIASENISTIYYPTGKITMLPEEVIAKYSLDAAKIMPAVSLYFRLNQDLEIIDYDLVVERLKIAANLRIEELDGLFAEGGGVCQYENELKILLEFAGKLEEKRGKSSTNNLVLDYEFVITDDKIALTPRVRGNPIDKLVSELMILANCSFGRLLTNAFIPAIYRVKQPNLPVKMTANAASHTGLNVDYYTWATSPLRRSADLINQHQLIALALAKKDYYSSLDPIFLNVVTEFDSKYAKYLDLQSNLEKYWSLRYLIQEDLNEVTATFTYKANVQLDKVPISINVEGLTTAKAKGSQIVLKIYNINLVTLNFDFKIINHL